jgi:hypothetical protein
MTEPHKRANRHPKCNTAYRVKNWRQYDQALRDRGDITRWLSQEARSVSVRFVQQSREFMVEYL